MAKKQGICRNIDCDNYKQIVEVEAGEEFECPLCHQHLEEAGGGGSKKKKTANPDGSNWKKIAAIAGAIVGLGAIGGGIYALTSGTDEPKPAFTLSLNHTQKTLKVGESDTIVATVKPADAQATIVYRASNRSNAVEADSNGIVTAKEEGESKVQVLAIAGKDTVKAICAYKVEAEKASTEIEQLAIKGAKGNMKKGDTQQLAFTAIPDPNNEAPVWESSNPAVATVDASGLVTAVAKGKVTITIKASKTSASVNVTVTENTTPPTSGTGTLKLSYGTYTGVFENGYPNGQGRLVYSKSRQINRFDSKGRTANAGDVVQGTFKNGFFTVGKHFDSRGNMIETINVGVAEDAYEQK